MWNCTQFTVLFVATLFYVPKWESGRDRGKSFIWRGAFDVGRNMLINSSPRHQLHNFCHKHNIFQHFGWTFTAALVSFERRRGDECPRDVPSPDDEHGRQRWVSFERRWPAGFKCSLWSDAHSCRTNRAAASDWLDRWHFCQYNRFGSVEFADLWWWSYHLLWETENQPRVDGEWLPARSRVWEPLPIALLHGHVTDVQSFRRKHEHGHDKEHETQSDFHNFFNNCNHVQRNPSSYSHI